MARRPTIARTGPAALPGGLSAAVSTLHPAARAGDYRSPETLRTLLDIQRAHPERFLASLPFAAGDVTAGSEIELQAVVAGGKGSVDLPLTIEGSNYYANVLRRNIAGDTPRKRIEDVERFLEHNPEQVWENSWVRIPRKALTPLALEVLEHDLLADKTRSDGGRRSDAGKFFMGEGGDELLRLPVSYVLKLALADLIGSATELHPVIRQTGLELLDHFLSDNTSPETHSFHVIHSDHSMGLGRGIAEEAAKRMLLTQLLAMYANREFGAGAGGQRIMVYLSPHTPIRQRRLNEAVSDSFYRELFMSPCLSGWDRGEEKQEYMHVCHEVLSRSQLNSIAKLRHAGIITNNLIVLPDTSNTSLANNAVHISMGSRTLTDLRSDKSCGFTGMHEKYFGDLLVKIVEHFLPLFVNTYSAAPYRLDFVNFHPERVLAFLPHELDYTHLRMLWRRWKKKAQIRIFSRPITPFGPEWLDRAVGKLLGLKGDFVPDFRLIDHLVCLMSPESSPALNGVMGNTERAKMDLAHLGVFDPRMFFYLLFKPQEFDATGFSGFEARHYSLFENICEDMGPAADLQNLIMLLASNYIVKGELTHAHIPDHPFCESERRQVIFGTAIGLPTFFIKEDTDNLFLRRIVGRTADTRASRRYPGYLRVYHAEYRKALLGLIVEEGAELIELLNIRETISDLRSRVENRNGATAAARLTKSICDSIGCTSPMDLCADEFNTAAESFYRHDLRERHMDEAFHVLERHVRLADSATSVPGYAPAEALHAVTAGRNIYRWLDGVRMEAIEDRLSLPDLRMLISLLLVTIHNDRISSEKQQAKQGWRG